MKTIILNNSVRGLTPDGEYLHKGDVVEVDEETAAALIESGTASECEVDEETAAAIEAAEEKPAKKGK